MIAERNRKLLPISGSVSQQTVDDAEAAERSAGAKVQADRAAVAQSQINLGLHAGHLADRPASQASSRSAQGALVGSRHGRPTAPEARS